MTLSLVMMYVADFFAGAFLCNSVPHLVAGFQGLPFPSPFAKPSGIGDSSPLVNVLWGTFNLLTGILLLSRNPVMLFFHLSFAVLAGGFLAMGVMHALHFGRCRKAGRTNPSTSSG